MNRLKKKYQKPQVSIEVFTMNENIATGCGEIINMGPGDETWGYEACTNPPMEDVPGEISLFTWNPGDKRDPARANFYPETCECYYNAGNSTVFTS